jgi:hypothetical protein
MIGLCILQHTLRRRAPSVVAAATAPTSAGTTESSGGPPPPPPTMVTKVRVRAKGKDKRNSFGNSSGGNNTLAWPSYNPWTDIVSMWSRMYPPQQLVRPP